MDTYFDLYALSKDQIKILLEYINNTPIKGESAEIVVELKKALKTPKITEKENG